MTVYRMDIHPRAPLHQGIHGRAPKSGALVHSDTLHAALIAAAAATGAHVDDLERMRELPMSSLYPTLHGKPLYPKPFLRPPGADNNRERPEDDQDHKRWKKLRLVSEAMLRAWLTGDVDTFDACELRDGVAALTGEFPEWPGSGLLADARHTGVVVDRNGADATPYDRPMVWVNAKEGVGLYCLVEAGDGDGPWLEEAFTRLGWAGLGGERASGLGGFDVARCAPDAVPKFANGAANRFMTLGLYLPRKDEVDAGVLDAPAAYDCVLRGGWIHGVAGAEKAKHALRFCLEGGVFNGSADNPGDVRDVRPDGWPHPVWRSGRPLVIPFQCTTQPGGLTS